ncbi:MAG TPA: hypothetical protein VJ970_04340 [Flavobacteriaceae bacterium]|nr:hypothetical protein [Flavobacteriaceae bacterium]
MKKLLLVLFILSATFVFSQQTINQLNAKGEKTGIWKKYYPNKNIRYQGQFVNGKEVGVFKFYSKNTSKHPIAIKTYAEKTDSVAVQFFTEKGVLQSEGKMIDKRRVGLWKYYHKKSKELLSVENYNNGKLDGEVKTFYKNGTVTEHLHYKKGIKHGVAKRFSSEGILLEKLTYKEGVLHGDAVFYNTNGDLIMSGKYKNGEKVGDWTVNPYQRD